MKKQLDQVSEFHKMFNHPILESPRIPNMKRAQLRYALLHEELEEFRQAILAGNLVEVVDALCDLQYVLCGAVLEFGLKDIFEKLFDEVQRSNMSKACDTEEDALATIQYYEQYCDAYGIATYKMHYEKKDGKYLVYRSTDMKTLKSVNYLPAQIKDILNEKIKEYEINELENRLPKRE